MENSPVRFRRGGSELPQETKDGYITFDETTGRMYVDSAVSRKAVNGRLFGVSDTEGDNPVKIVSIPGVDRYFEGLTIAVVFRHVSKYLTDPVKISIDYGDGFLPVTDMMVDRYTAADGSNLEENTPYSFTYLDGRFILDTCSSARSDFRWKSISGN